MNTYFAQLRISRPDDTYRQLDVSVSADSFSHAMRMMEIWGAAVEAVLPEWRVTIESASGHKKKGSSPTPLLASNLLADAFRKLTLEGRS